MVKKSLVMAAVLCACSSNDANENQGGAGAAGGSDDGGTAANAGTGGGSGSGASGAGASPQDPMGLPNFVPTFPGAGTGNASDPLVGGMLCDYVAHDGEKGATPVTQCFFGPGQTTPAATLEQVLECVDGKDSIHLRLTFDPSFVDNTYGTGAIGWPARGKKEMMAPVENGKHHSFNDLLESDHAELKLTNAAGEVVSHFALDYVSEAAGSPSGYASLGVSGGEGEVIVGEASDVVAYSTSIDENLNERGYGSYTVDSPATDASYAVNADAPEWDYRVVYEVWVDIDVMGTTGFGDAFIEFVHASPSKADSNTIVVEPGPCPPCPDPYKCWDVPPGDPCVNAPDEAACSDAGVPPPTEGCVITGPDQYLCAPGDLPPLPPDACVETAPDQYLCPSDAGVPMPPPPPPVQWCTDHPELPECNVD
jgi:hypothetical protein